MPGEDQHTALLAELDFHKVEYSALREEILQWLAAERQILNLSLVAFAGLLGFLPLILERQLYALLLIIPFVFHVLLWEMLHLLRIVNGLSMYIVNKLAPRVNTILEELGSDHDQLTVLGWELESREGRRSKRLLNLLLEAIMPTRHWVPILIIGGLIIAYAVTIRSQNYAPTSGELLLVLLNLLFLILAAAQNVSILTATRRIMGEPQSAPDLIASDGEEQETDPQKDLPKKRL